MFPLMPHTYSYIHPMENAMHASRTDGRMDGGRSERAEEEEGREMRACRDRPAVYLEELLPRSVPPSVRENAAECTKYV